MSLLCLILVGIEDYFPCANSKIEHVCDFRQNDLLTCDPPFSPAQADMKSQNTFGPLDQVAKSSVFPSRVVVVF